MSLADVRQTVIEVVALALGLPEDHVVWANQNTNQPTLPYCALTLSPLQNPAQDGVQWDYDGTRPAGQEIELYTLGYREATLGLQVFTEQTVDSPDVGASSLGYVERARSKLTLPTLNDRLASKGLSFFDLSAPVQFVPQLVSVGFRGRATWDIRIYAPAEFAREWIGYISSVSGTATIHGGAIDPETASFSASG